MNTILIELWIPAAGHGYDVLIPRGSKLHVVQQLLAAAAKELSAGKYIPSEDACLYDEIGTILDINMTVEESGLKNGSRLMLI